MSTTKLRAVATRPVTTPYSLGHVDDGGGVDDDHGGTDDSNSDDYEDVDLMPGGCVRAVTTLPSILVRARHKSSASKPAVFTTTSNLDVERQSDGLDPRVPSNILELNGGHDLNI